MGCQLLRVLLKQVCDLLSKIFQFQKTWKLTLAPLLYKISPYWVSFLKHFFYFDISKSQEIKGALSCLRNFWQLKAPEKWWKILLISCQKPFSFSRYLNFFLDFGSCIKTTSVERCLISMFLSLSSAFSFFGLL